MESQEAINDCGGVAVFQQNVSDGIQGLVTLAARHDKNTEAARLACDSRSCVLVLIVVTAAQTLVGNSSHRIRRPTPPI